jgi:hypothetical protein
MATARRSLPRESSAAIGNPQVGGSRGVSDPPSAAPDFAPGLVHRGSLTPRLRIESVRTHGSSHTSSTRHGAGPTAGRPLVARSATRRSRPSHLFS